MISFQQVTNPKKRSCFKIVFVIKSYYMEYIIQLYNDKIRLFMYFNNRVNNMILDY